MQVTAALARRLLDLTCAQWAESQVADRQMRCVLHDEILPDLHAALILLGPGDGVATAEAGQLLATAHRQTADLLRALPVAPPTRPQGRLLEDLRQLVEVEMASHFDQVRFAADPAATPAAERIEALSAEVIFYAVRELARNAARHGRSWGGQPLTLVVTVRGGNELVIEVRDNGQRMGATPAELSSGQGLALHAGMLAVVSGALSFTRGEAGGTNAAIRLGVGQLT